MKSQKSLDQDIFDLVLEFYRSPSDYPDLLDAKQVLPDDITDLLELTAGEVAARSKIFSRAAASEVPSELIDATSYFTEQVLFAPGGDHYRILGLNHNASMGNIKKHYELLVSLFYQDKDNNSIQSNEADFSRLNRAYSVLREKSKRDEYDKVLKSQGTYRGGESITPENKVVTEKNETVPKNVQSLDSYKKSDSGEVQLADKDQQEADVPNPNDDTRPSNQLRKSKIHNKSGLPKILIVDDSATVRAGLSLTLNKEFECVTAKDGEKGWKILNNDPDILLVLTDLDMPVLNGYEFIKKIRSDNEARIKTIPVIVVTGTEDINAKQKALNLGADDFLAKSTDYIEVLTRIRVHYKLVEARKELLSGSEKKEIQNEQQDEEFRISRYADDHTDVPILTKQKYEYSRLMTIGAFVVISIVVISLIYFTRTSPDSGKVALESTIPSKTDNSDQSVLKSGDGEIKSLTENSGSPEDTKSAVIGKDLKQDLVEKKPEKVKKKAIVENKKTVVRDTVKSKPEKKVVKKSSLAKQKNAADLKKAEVKPFENTKVENEPVSKTNKQAETKKGEHTLLSSAVKNTTSGDTQVLKPKSKTIVHREIVAVEKSSMGSPGTMNIEVNPDSALKAPAIVSNQQKDETKTFTTVSTVEVDTLNDPKSIAGRLPVTDDVPSVNKINKNISAENNLSESTAAITNTPIPRTQVTGISKRELSLFIFKFIRSYESGNLFQFMGLFDEFAVTEDRTDRNGIAEDYKDLFEKSAARRFVIGDLDWKIEGAKAMGNGFFEVQIWPQGSDGYKTFTGELSISVYKKPNAGLLISELFHNF